MRIFNLGRENLIGDNEATDSVQMFDWIASQHGKILQKIYALGHCGIALVGGPDSRGGCRVH